MPRHTAIKLLLEGHTCSESILMAYAPDFDLAPETAARLAAGFAGGLTQGKTCGAVTAATMVIGLKYGPGLTRDPYKKDLCFAMTQEFFHRFRQRRQTTNCGKILTLQGIDPTDPRQMKQLRERKMICDEIVKEAATILDALLREET